MATGIKSMEKGVDYFEGASEAPKGSVVDAQSDLLPFVSQDQELNRRVHDLIDETMHLFLTTDEEERYSGESCLEERGFHSISPSVIYHADLAGWLLKAGGKKRDSVVFNVEGAAGNNHYANLHRVVMADRIREVIAEEELSDLRVPEKLLIPSKYKAEDQGLHQQYYVLCERLHLLSIEEATKELEALPRERQIQIAEQICTVIERTGFADAHLGNIRLTADRKVAFIDTEPQGVLVDSNDQDGFVASVALAARVGLRAFASNFGAGLPVFKEVAEQRLEAVRKE